ncbi:hypothetical protein PGT21_036270 [Puccinia graminis f. sp. tritici]|uniref:Vacuolar membrane protein n=1 Tax=Puccinia graminis f. sp. tritici TaxID=56615 RepID=A0A5B0RMF2_PUCGR|nr:hypothetical protein PGT21_036270 [Puccinia graminis f. sp. tritici]KAA1126235.1 hypothetical protein PGTUg99_017546 [Puccinia graminis f. sp. tritici]
MDISAYEPIPSTSRINSRPGSSNKLISSISTIPQTQLDTETCSLLGPFSILIQAIMAFIILASLLYKRHREKPKRKYHIWTADVSKQVIGQAFVHMLNIFISDSMASLPSKGNPCALYFMNIFIDTTIGVFVLFLALNTITKLVCKTLRRTPSSLGLSSGIYPHPFLMSWIKQISIYFLGLVILKLFVIGLFWLGGEALIKFGNGVIEGISHDPKIQILMVVMVGPTILNVLQFLLIDSFIKHKPSLNPEELEPEDGRRFLSGESDLDSDDQDDEEDDDDDNENGRKPRGLPNSGDHDRVVRKKKDYQSERSTRHQHTRLSNPSNLHGSLSAVVADVQNPHSYPPRTSHPETRERNQLATDRLDLMNTVDTRLRTIQAISDHESSQQNMSTNQPSRDGIPPDHRSILGAVEPSHLSAVFDKPTADPSETGTTNPENDPSWSPTHSNKAHKKNPGDRRPPPRIRPDQPTRTANNLVCASPTELRTGFDLRRLNPLSSASTITPLSNPHHHAVY